MRLTQDELLERVNAHIVALGGNPTHEELANAMTADGLGGFVGDLVTLALSKRITASLKKRAHESALTLRYSVAQGE